MNLENVEFRLGSSSERSAGSIPVSPTKTKSGIGGIGSIAWNHVLPIGVAISCLDCTDIVNYITGMILMLEGKYYTVTQAAEIAGCTVSYVRQLLRKEEIRGEKIGERAWLIPVSQIAKLKESPSGKPGRPRSGKK